MQAQERAEFLLRRQARRARAPPIDARHPAINATAFNAPRASRLRDRFLISFSLISTHAKPVALSFDDYQLAALFHRHQAARAAILSAPYARTSRQLVLDDRLRLF